MRAWPLHVVFATILAGSLAAKERAPDVLVRHDNLEPAVTRVARSHGLAFQGDVTLPGTTIRALVFDAPGCPRPVLVVVLSAVIDLEPVLRFAREQGDVLRYVYIGRSWEKPDRLAVFTERMKYAALAPFGLTRYVPSQDLLLVESPSRCESAIAVDWRDVWNRDYVEAATATPTEPATR
jgi:hypothetical protein